MLLYLDDTLTRDELREANALMRTVRLSPLSLTRRYTWDEAVNALHHVRYDFTDEPAKAILYSLTERFANVVTGAEYAVSYDNGDGMFYVTFHGVTARTVLIHEANAGTCWCLGLKLPAMCNCCGCVSRYCICSCCCGK